MLLKLPDPARSEYYYHIRKANNRVRVVVRRPYAYHPEGGSIRLRLEVRRITGESTCEWVTVPGSVTALHNPSEGLDKAARWYYGGWVPILKQAIRYNRGTHTYLEEYLPNEEVYRSLVCDPQGACESHGRCWTHSDWVD